MKKKRILIVTILLALILSCFTLSVRANEQIYNIDSANFYIQINKDGSATVTETWVVNYKQGTFSRFYKNIYLDVPKDEDFNIKFECATVDGNPCTITTDTASRHDYTYAILKGTDTLRYEIYIGSENEVRQFSITYTLYDVVKYVNNEYYLFKYRLLPLGYKPNVSNFFVEINVPDDACSTLSINSTDGQAVQDKAGIFITANNVSDLYKVAFKFNGDIDSSVPIRGETTTMSQDTKELLLFIGSAMFFLITMLILFFLQRKREEKLRNELAMNPNIIIHMYQKWVPKYLTPSQFAYILAGNKYLGYLVGLAELANQRIVKIQPDYEYIAYPVNHQNNNILMVLEECRLYALTKKMATDSDGEYWLLPTKYLELYFGKSKGYNMAYKSTYLLVSGLLKVFEINENELLTDVKHMRDLGYILNKDKKLPIVELSALIDNFNYYPYDIPYYCLQTQDKESNDIHDESYRLTLLALSAYKATHGNSDSSSGCSSCGGCGGGCGGCGGSD